MPRPYNALRRKMLAESVKIDDVAREMKCSRQTVSNKLRNVSPWTLEECWIVMEMLSIKPRMMARYFPRSGKNE